MIIIQYILFLTFFIHVWSIGIHHHHNWLKIYENSFKKNNKMFDLFDKLNNKIKKYLIEVNFGHNYLSDEDSLLIESFMRLLY